MYVKNEVVLIFAKFGVDLINTSKVSGRKTKWPRFCATLYISLTVSYYTHDFA